MLSFPLNRIRKGDKDTIRLLTLISDKGGTKRRGKIEKMLQENNVNKKPAKLKVMEVIDFPKQFFLRNEVLSDPEEYAEIGTDEGIRRSKARLKSGKLRKRSPEKSDYLDLDFMMPNQVREILLEEGLSKEVIDSTLGVDEKRHRKNMQLTLLAEKYKRVPYERKTSGSSQSRQKQFPSIYLDQNSENGIGCDNCRNVRIRQERRNSRIRPWKDTNYPDKMTSNDEDNENSGGKEDTFFLTEPEKIRWFSDQQEEKVLMGNHFDPPRIVLISSKIPKNHLIPKLLHENGRTLHVIYDFDTWSFSDITDAIQKKLESVKPSCKAKSVILLCQGGSGYLYLLRKFVVTPQKLHKESYQDVREFWKRLGGQISKICQGESKIHIVCKNVNEGRQGKEVIRSIQRLVHSDMVKVEVADNSKEQGLRSLNLYFNVGRFNLWFETMDDSDIEVDFGVLDMTNNNDESSDDEDNPRTISSIAAQIECKEDKHVEEQQL